MKIAIWCRHVGDSIVGIGPHIPWHVSSDFKRFKRFTQGHSLIVGETTYETFPNRTLPNRKMYVLTFNKDYQVSDSVNHFVVTDYCDFAQMDGDDFYISGGASVYKLFMQNQSPDIILDSVYMGDLDKGLEGAPVDIALCAQIMEHDYDKITQGQELDNVVTSVWVKKGITPTAATMEHILTVLKQDQEGK